MGAGWYGFRLAAKGLYTGESRYNAVDPADLLDNIFAGDRLQLKPALMINAKTMIGC